MAARGGGADGLAIGADFALPSTLVGSGGVSTDTRETPPSPGFSLPVLFERKAGNY